jgi:hypothetical protein
MTKEPLTVTPASAWRTAREQGELIRLPGCGNVARLVRPPLARLALTNGGVPNPLSREVQRLLSGSAPPRDENERWKNYVANMRAMQEIAQLCLVEPKLRLDGPPQEGEIGPEDLTDLDYTWLFYTWVEGAAEQVAPFRVTQEP